MPVQRFFLSTEFSFGPGARKELTRLVQAEDRVIIITDAGLVKAGVVAMVEEVLQGRVAGLEVFSQVSVNPHAADVEAACRAARTCGATAVVAVGGGSPMDVAKMVSVLLTNPGTLADYQWERKPFTRPGLKLIVLPTTAGTGSEGTATAVIIDRDTKQGIVGDELLPRAALLDPELMASLPPAITATTGMDALTHAVEALVARGANPFTNALAAEAVRLIAKYLRRAFACGDDLEAREGMALASTLAGVAMDQAGLGVVHAMAGPLSSYYNVPHGLANAVVLPLGMRYNLVAVPEKYAFIAGLLGVPVQNLTSRAAALEAVRAVQELQADLQIRPTLKDDLRDPADIEKFAREAVAMFICRANPRVVSAADCQRLFAEVFVYKE
ncbi:iron-containing alcohol dehydrogenase [Moorella naiadis]|uniref:iron-containing alcohol dehydrogenase n=1 Tax=Moorella naiadis (nom. illeg.) TaxID=3093670 RepID=UPI003D9C837E